MKTPTGVFFDTTHTAAVKRGKEHMADFTPINTQEEFDAAIKSRIARERTTLEKRYEESLAAEKQKLMEEQTKLQDAATVSAKTIEDLTKERDALIKERDEAADKVKGFERQILRAKVAAQAGLPAELADRLQGETEEEMAKDAEVLAKVSGSGRNRVIPLANLNDGGGAGGDVNAAWKELSSIFGKE